MIIDKLLKLKYLDVTSLGKISHNGLIWFTYIFIQLDFQRYSITFQTIPSYVWRNKCIDCEEARRRFRGGMVKTSALYTKGWRFEPHRRRFFTPTVVLLSFKTPETVLWTIAKISLLYYYSTTVFLKWTDFNKQVFLNLI